MKRIFRIVIIALMVVGILYGFRDINKNRDQIKLKQVEIQSSEARLKLLETQYNTTLHTLDNVKGDSEQTKKQLQDTTQKLQQLEQEKQDLQRQLQAKADARRVYAASIDISGTKLDWLNASGIPSDQWAAVDYIVSHESGWNPQSVNASSGATGLPQALPYSKTGCAFGDPVCQLKWADSYAKQRYGGWWAAQSYWSAHGNW